MAWIENLNNIYNFFQDISVTILADTSFRGPAFLVNRVPYICWSNGEIRNLLDNSLLTSFTEMGYVSGIFVAGNTIYAAGGATGSNPATGYFKKIVLDTLTETTLYSHVSADAAGASCSFAHPGWGTFSMGGDAFYTIRKIQLSDDTITELAGAATELLSLQVGGTTTTCYYKSRVGSTSSYKSIPMAGGGSSDIASTGGSLIVGQDGWHIMGQDIWDGPHSNSWTLTGLAPVSLTFLNNGSPYHVLVTSTGSSYHRLQHIRLNADFSVTEIREYYYVNSVDYPAYNYFYRSGIYYPQYHGTTKPSVLFRPYPDGYYEWKLPYKDMI